MIVIDMLKKQKDFTFTEKRIAEYILNNLSTIPDLNVEDLAKKTFTSNSSVIRVCKKSGFKGFTEFRRAIATFVNNQTYLEGSVNANFPFDPKDSEEVIAKKMMDLTIETVRKTHARMSFSNLKKSADIINNSQRIFLFAVGDSQIRARSFQNKLAKIDKFLILSEEYSDGLWAATNINKNDAALFVSYDGNIADHKKVIKHLHKKKIPTILITGNSESELIPFATTLLLAYQDETNYSQAKISTFSSQLALDYILNTLFSVIYSSNYIPITKHVKHHLDFINNPEN